MSYHTLAAPLVIACTLAALAGCASTSVYLGSDPGMHVPPIAGELEIPIDPELAGLIDIRSIDMHGNVTTDHSSGRSLYLSVDLTGVLARPNLGLEDGDALDLRLRDRRNDIMSVLLFVSDFNAETYLSRAFANRAFIETGNSVLQDVLAGISTGAATVSPPAAGAVSLSALVIGSAAEQVNASFYLNQTFQAMETVIRTERALLRREIRRRMNVLPYDQYALHDGLTDIRRYSELCSVRAGLQGLARVAELDRRQRLPAD